MQLAIHRFASRGLTVLQVWNTSWHEAGAGSQEPEFRRWWRRSGRRLRGDRGAEAAPTLERQDARASQKRGYNGPGLSQCSVAAVRKQGHILASAWSHFLQGRATSAAPHGRIGANAASHPCECRIAG